VTAVTRTWPLGAWLAASLLPGLVLVPAGGDRMSSQEAVPRPIHIVLVGDSTVTDDSGWGLGFRQFVNEKARVTNTAANGRSSKSFIDEGRWAAALKLKGDYYLIQFGHNDEPGKGPGRETDPATTYRQNMLRFVDDVRAMGATPVLVTSLIRRNFGTPPGPTITSTQTPYVDAVRQVAIDRRVALVDLFESSRELSERLGAEALAEVSPRTATGGVDTTHLNAKGSLLFGQLVVAELRNVILVLGPVLLREPVAGRVKLPVGRGASRGSR
jgi:lysophospholipase L1-like esterase